MAALGIDLQLNEDVFYAGEDELSLEIVLSNFEGLK